MLANTVNCDYLNTEYRFMSMICPAKEDIEICGNITVGMFLMYTVYMYM